MGRYDHLVHTFKKQYNYWGDFMPPYQAYFRGHDCMPGASFYSSYRCYMKEAFVDQEANFHTEEEYLCFTGYDMLDPWGSFDAEIEFWIGKDLNNMEQHIITKPTIVRIPPYTWHCPLQYRNVKKPVYFQVLHIRGKFAPFYYREQGKSYEIENQYFGGVKMCRLNDKVPCTVCGRCWNGRSDIEKAGDPKNAVEAAHRYKSAKI